MTRSTSGMSRPRAARSVVRRMQGEVEVVNWAKFVCRILGDCFPCKGMIW